MVGDGFLGKDGLAIAVLECEFDFLACLGVCVPVSLFVDYGTYFDFLAWSVYAAVCEDFCSGGVLVLWLGVGVGLPVSDLG